MMEKKREKALMAGFCLSYFGGREKREKRPKSDEKHTPIPRYPR
jgi:hypothetical protein